MHSLYFKPLVCKDEFYNFLYCDTVICKKHLTRHKLLLPVFSKFYCRDAKKSSIFAQLEISHDKIAEFCKRNHISKLSLFGSALRGELRPDSDIDLLVEFDPDHIPRLITLASMEIELSEIIGRKVDLRTPQDLSRYFRQEVVDSAEVQYAEG
ncbi:MAG: nucleotidyltransferase family protein [Thermodesulfovibrionales bacterium]|nr:nucleotidyltransferase family protein [Thermodesulfovibrionales bacterium]